MAYRDVLNGSCLFANLDEATVDSILLSAAPEVVPFKRKNVIWNEGDLVEGIGLMLTGTMLCQHYHSDGKMQLLRIFKRYDLMNLESAVSLKRTSPVHVIGNRPGTYLWFPYESLFENDAIPSSVLCTIQRNLLLYLADDSVRLINKNYILARHTVRARILFFLSFLRRRQGDTVDIGMTQEEFAQFLCVDRSSLSQELTKLKQAGMIDVYGSRYHLYYPAEVKKLRDEGEPYLEDTELPPQEPLPKKRRRKKKKDPD